MGKVTLASFVMGLVAHSFLLSWVHRMSGWWQWGSVALVCLVAVTCYVLMLRVLNVFSWSDIISNLNKENS